jgi:hypothetical protein
MLRAVAMRLRYATADLRWVSIRMAVADMAAESVTVPATLTSEPVPGTGQAVTHAAAGLPDDIRRTAWRTAVWVRLREVEESVERALAAQDWQLNRRVTPWLIDVGAADQQQVRNQAKELASARAVVTTISEYVQAADGCLKAKSSLLARLWDAFTGQMLMTAYTNLHAAEKQRILLLSGDQLMARLPSIRARASAYLHESDPCQIALEGIPELTAPGHQVLAGMQQQILSTVAQAVNGQRGHEATAAEPAVARLTGMLGTHQQIVAEAFGACCSAEDMQQTQVRLFRGVLLGTFAGLLIPIIALSAAAAKHPGLLPMCLHTSVKAMFCASGNKSPTGGDLPLVLSVGAVGAALAVAKTLAGLSVAGVRYSLSVAQGLLKIALGAITAMLGLLLLQTQNLPGVLASQAGVLMAAVVFGYAQQLFTTFIDQRAASLLRAASPTTPPAGPGMMGGAARA